MARAVALAALVAALTAATAGARSDANAVIRHGVGIGKVRLGMTEAQVRAALGKPSSTLDEAGSFGRRTHELQYDGSAWLVRLGGRPLRVVQVATTLRRERTREGLGVGSFERDVLKAYPRLRCERLRTGPFPGSPNSRMLLTQVRECVLDTGRGTQTVFSSVIERKVPWERLLPEDWEPRARVLEVAVRADSLR
jgi:hypothetical protein